MHWYVGRVVLRKILFLLVATIWIGAPACSSDPPANDAEAPFQSVPPRVYVAKVKNILVGLAPTDAELKAVEADPNELASLVDGWMTLPQYSQKMMRFFELAFQQTQIASDDFTDQVYAQLGWNRSTTPLLLQNAKESVARTMVELSAQNRPFTEAMTTRQFMMTTALKELYAFLDVWEIDNDGNIFDEFRTSHRDVPIVVEAAQGPIPIAETLDPTSANYMHWYNPDVATPGTQIPECLQDPAVLAPKALALHYLLLADAVRFALGGGAKHSQVALHLGARAAGYHGDRRLALDLHRGLPSALGDIARTLIVYN